MVQVCSRWVCVDGDDVAEVLEVLDLNQQQSATEPAPAEEDVQEVNHEQNVNDPTSACTEIEQNLDVTLPSLDVHRLACLYVSYGVTGDDIRRMQNSPAFVEVFSGNAVMARSAASAGFDPVFTIDRDSSHSPTHCMDVTEPANQRQIKADMIELIKRGCVIVAHLSPDCSQFSVARTNSPEARDTQRGIHVLKCGLECFNISGICCAAAWTAENPFHTRDYCMWSIIKRQVCVVDYCCYAWPAQKRTGFAASDAQLLAALEQNVSKKCPGRACPQHMDGKHAENVQTLSMTRRKCIPPMLAHLIVYHVRRRVQEVVLDLAAAVDSVTHTAKSTAFLSQQAEVGCTIIYDPGDALLAGYCEKDGMRYRAVHVHEIVRIPQDEILLVKVTPLQPRDNVFEISAQSRPRLLAISTADIYHILPKVRGRRFSMGSLY